MAILSHNRFLDLGNYLAQFLMVLGSQHRLWIGEVWVLQRYRNIVWRSHVPKQFFPIISDRVFKGI